MSGNLGARLAALLESDAVKPYSSFAPFVRISATNERFSYVVLAIA